MISLSQIQEDFSILEDWEDRYNYLIDLGAELPCFPDEYKVDSFKVDGCMSQVWLYPKCTNGIYNFLADSDALIVKGLIAIILSAYSGKNINEIHQVPIEKIFSDLGLENNLSPTRRNGFFAMVDKIKNLK